MTNKKRKGFTIVELVIVIAVVAILAGVLIPTFASIIDKANQSTDIQAVRQMNVLLKAESVEDKPTDVNKVIKIVSEAGYDTVEKRTPKSKDHGFYWHAAENIILLAKDKEGETPVLVYPLDNEILSEYFSTESVDVLTFENGFYTLEVEEGGTPATPTTPTGTPIVDLAGLEAALKNENGENYYFAPEVGNGIIVDKPITDTATTNVTIDLNGYTLTLGADASLTINGNVTFTDSKSDTEDLTSEIIIEYDGAKYEWDIDWEIKGIIYSPGFKVKTNGTLTISNLKIVGNRYINIENEGKVSLNAVNDFNVTPVIYYDEVFEYIYDGYGVYNEGSLNVGTIGENSSSTFTVNGGNGIYNADTAIIKGGEFIAAGEDVCLVENSSGTMNIDGTKFSEADGVSYSKGAPISASGGNINLDNVEVKTDATSDRNVECSEGANVNITGGLFNGKFNVRGSSSYIYISGDTKYNETDCFGDTESIKSFKEICCFGYNADRTTVQVIKCSYDVTKDNNKERVTTFIIHNSFYAFNGLAGIDGFGGTNGLIIPEKSVVELDSSPELPIDLEREYLPQTILTQDMDIKGTLIINGGLLFAGDKNASTMNITVFDDGTLVLNARFYGTNKDGTSNLDLDSFLALPNVVTAEDDYIISVSNNTITVDPKS